jgi:hypothetical protein
VERHERDRHAEGELADALEEVAAEDGARARDLARAVRRAVRRVAKPAAPMNSPPSRTSRPTA